MQLKAETDIIASRTLIIQEIFADYPFRNILQYYSTVFSALISYTRIGYVQHNTKNIILIKGI